MHMASWQAKRAVLEKFFNFDILTKFTLFSNVIRTFYVFAVAVAFHPGWINPNVSEALPASVASLESSVQNLSTTVSKNYQTQSSSLSSNVQLLNSAISQIERNLTSNVDNLSEAIIKVKTDLTDALQLSVKGWIFNGVCFYRVSFSYRSFKSAQSECALHGANLASIHHADELAFVEQIIRVRFPGFNQVWLGANDRNSEGNWTWLDGTAMDYINWNAGEPNGGVWENCMENVLGHGWNDNYCHHSRGYVCKKCFWPSHCCALSRQDCTRSKYHLALIVPVTLSVFSVWLS